MPKLPPKIALYPMTFYTALTISTTSTILLALANVSQAQTGQLPQVPQIPPRGSSKSEGTELAVAIKAFNARSVGDPIGKRQSPLTGEEVVAAIRLMDRKDHPLAPDTILRSLERIAHTNKLPAGVAFEALTSLDPGGDFVFDTWYVRINLPKEDGGTYSFPVRSSTVRSRPVAEVARDLEAQLQTMPQFPGRYRLEDRLRLLKKRALLAARR
ncbi:MAG: hypothetical protein H7145_23715 [Akkermansiaceae bacterium]|nr:hypothetical protein [Armatimonadota bacterium]